MKMSNTPRSKLGGESTGQSLATTARSQIETRLRENRRLMRVRMLDADPANDAWMRSVLQRSVDDKKRWLSELASVNDAA